MAQENGGVVWVVMGGTGVNGLTWHSWFLKGTHAVMCYLTILVLLTYLNGGILFFFVAFVIGQISRYKQKYYRKCAPKRSLPVSTRLLII